MSFVYESKSHSLFDPQEQYIREALSTKMAPSAVDYRGIMTNGVKGSDASKIAIMNPHEMVNFDPSLKPKDYQIKGTDPGSKVLFVDVNLIDSTGADPFKGDVYIEGM